MLLLFAFSLSAAVVLEVADQITLRRRVQSRHLQEEIARPSVQVISCASARSADSSSSPSITGCAECSIGRSQPLSKADQRYYEFMNDSAYLSISLPPSCSFGFTHSLNQVEYPKSLVLEVLVQFSRLTTAGAAAQRPGRCLQLSEMRRNRPSASAQKSNLARAPAVSGPT